MPPGFIRFALIRSFSYSFGATAFDDCQFLFLHLNILQVYHFILGLYHGNGVFLFVLLIKVPCLLQKMCRCKT